MVAIKDADFSGVDAAFCCLPHGTTQVISCFLFIYSLLNANLTSYSQLSCLQEFFSMKTAQ